MFTLSLVMVVCCLSAADSAEPTIVLRQSGASTAASFEVTGLSEVERAAFAGLPPTRQSATLRVFVEGALDDPPPIGGTVMLAGDTLRFMPRYPLEPGVSYRAVFDRGALAESSTPAKVVSEVFTFEKAGREPTTVVEHVYPSSNRLPENQLKFYLHFSAPMSRGEAYRHVRLLDAEGREVDGAFLELGEELWDAEFRRFTLLFDPGRVKRGLKPREELGPVLREGESYTLVIDGNWRDATRTPLNGGARKSFSVGPPDESPIDPQTWRIEPPEAGSLDLLVVRFRKPLDHALLSRVVWIENRDGNKIAGSITTGDDEACWQFMPRRPWAAGDHRLVAETTLEDLAGNAIGRAFEVDEFAPVQERIESETVSIPFVVE